MELTNTYFDVLEANNFLLPLFDSIPDAHFFVKDTNSKFIACSKSFAITMGASCVEEVIGKTDYDFSADFLAEAFIADDQCVIQSGKALINRIELVPTEKSIDWLSTTKLPLLDRSENVVGLAGITRRIEDNDEFYQGHPELRKIVYYIRNNFGEKITIADLAEIAEISQSSIERLFRKTFGISPFMYLQKTRINAACQMLKDHSIALVDIAVKCGFNDQTNMTRAFRTEIKITPLRYRKRFSEKLLST